MKRNYQKSQDLTGKKFGYWTVIKLGHIRQNQWLIGVGNTG